VKFVFIVGARPNFIKIAPIYDIIGNYGNIEPILVHTGQHFDKNMSEIFFDDLKLPKPDFHFSIQSNTQTKQTSEIMNKLEDLFIEIKPDVVVVIGDVSSTLAGALVASKLNIKLVHIEAGLRSFNKSMPEEINRIVADHLSDLLFAPSQTSMINLKNEGLEDKSYFTGDLMFDAVIRNLPIAEVKSNILNKLNLKPNEFVFTTLHRPYNVDNPNKLDTILKTLGDIDYQVVFSIHPRTQNIIKENSIKIPSNIITIEPVGYLDSLILQKNAYKVVTDSGGIQKEAFFLKTPCITLRPETEWVETVECGANILVNIAKLNNNVFREFEDKVFNSNPYGFSDSAEKMINLMLQNI